MAPKPASTAGKAPMSTASKAPAKPTEGVKGTKKTKDNAPADGEKKKRKKVRKETYSSYIYKGMLFDIRCWPMCLIITNYCASQSLNRSIPTRVSPTRRWPFSTASSTISLNALLRKLPVSCYTSTII